MSEDIVNLIEWNRWADDRKTLLEALTIINNRHREKVSSLEDQLKTERLSNKRLRAKIDELNHIADEEEDEDEPDYLSKSEIEELKRMVAALLSLTGDLVITSDREFLEQLDPTLATDEDFQDVEELYEQRERELNLRGLSWEGGAK
jgi:hypothetical protein